MSTEKRRPIMVMLVLTLVSIVYDRLFITRRPPAWMEKYTWATVVAGVLYTLAGLSLWDRQAAKRAFIAFVFSGWPMAAGDLWRWWERKQNGRSTVGKLTKEYGLD